MLVIPGAPQSRRQDGGPAEGSGLTSLGRPSLVVGSEIGLVAASAWDNAAGTARIVAA